MVCLLSQLNNYSHFNVTKLWCRWLRHYATSQKVAGSISDGVIGIIHWYNLPSCTMALGSTQPLTEMSTSGILCEVKVADATLPSSCADCLEIWKPQTSGSGRTCPGQYKDCFTFFLLKCTCKYAQRSFIFLYQWTNSVKKDLLVSSLYP